MSRLKYAERAMSAREKREELEFQRQSRYYDSPRHCGCTRPVLSNKLLQRLHISSSQLFHKATSEGCSIHSYQSCCYDTDTDQREFDLTVEYPYRLSRISGLSNAQRGSCVSEEPVKAISAREQPQGKPEQSTESNPNKCIDAIRIPASGTSNMEESAQELFEDMSTGDPLTHKQRNPTSSIPPKGRQIFARTRYSKLVTPKPTPFEQKLLQARFPKRACSIQRPSSSKATQQAQIPCKTKPGSTPTRPRNKS